MSDENEKRYNLGLPQELWEQVKDKAKSRKLTHADFIRRSIELGVMAAEIEDTPDDALILHRNGKDKKLRVFPKRYEDEDTFFL